MTTSIKKRILTSTEVCRIIETSSKHGVRALKFAGLFLEFNPPEPKVEVTEAGSPLTATEIAEIQDQESQKSLAQDELEVKRQKLDDLLIEDPLELERLIASGELEDESDNGYDGEQD